MSRSYNQGFFKPVNPEKYIGKSINNIVYRSSWELAVMKWLDLNPDVEQWSSEEFHIPYECKASGKSCRYFPDFLVKYKSGRTVLVEVKP